MQNFETACCITDTVWGLVARMRKANFEKIYQIKGRGSDKPLILFASKIDTIKKYTKAWDSELENLTLKHWPGALTIILERNANLPEWINPGYKHIGFRIPDSASVINLLNQTSDDLLLSTSANSSGEKPVANYQEALEIFGDKVDLVLKPEPDEKTGEMASTIVKYENGKIVILREGAARP